MDHIGLAGRIAEVSSAEVFVHPLETVRAYRPGGPLGKKRADFRRFFVEAGVPEYKIPQLVDLIVERNKAFCSPLARETPLDASTCFTFDDFTLKAIHTPGHSPGSVCLFNEIHGDLFTGDTLVPEVISNPTVESGANGRDSGFVSIAAHHASLDLIEALPVKRVLPGHGASFRDHVRRVRKIRTHHERRSERVVKILRNHKDYVNQYTVAHELFPELGGWDIFFGVSAARGHLNLLHSQGRIRMRRDGNQFVYQLEA
jgi:glyoxylase-like metal-dependent hydrolase (beta-lactamase superfamily II)